MTKSDRCTADSIGYTSNDIIGLTAGESEVQSDDLLSESKKLKIGERQINATAKNCDMCISNERGGW